MASEDAPLFTSYEGRVMAAPMVRVSNIAFRMFCADNGADLVFSEEIIANKVVRSVLERSIIKMPRTGVERELVELVTYEVRKGGPNGGGGAMGVVGNRSVVFQTIAKLTPSDTPEGCPLVFQLGANDAGKAAAAAKMMAPFVDGFDVNMGCPKNFSVENGMGASLMQKGGERAAVIMAAIRAAIGPTKPLSFKTRLHRAPTESVAFISRVAQAGQVHSVTIHCRTVDQRSETEPLYEKAAEVRRLLKTAMPHLRVIFNGSLGLREHQRPTFVPRPADAATGGGTRKQQLLEEAAKHGFDGCLVARGAMWNPRIFGDPAFTGALLTAEQQEFLPRETFRGLLRKCADWKVYFVLLKYHFIRAFQEVQHESTALFNMNEQATLSKNYEGMAAAIGGFNDADMALFKEVDLQDNAEARLVRIPQPWLVLTKHPSVTAPAVDPAASRKRPREADSAPATDTTGERSVAPAQRDAPTSP